MSYQIVYGKSNMKQNKKSHLWKGGLIMALLLGAFLGLRYIGSEGLRLENLLPGDGAVTAAAIRALVDRLRAGEGVLDAIDVFCRTVVDGAKLG